jgi:hypothetical protein
MSARCWRLKPCGSGNRHLKRADMSDLYSNDLECPHCGATFNYELTRCPNCGVNIYFPEDEEDGEFSKVFSRFVDSFRFPLGILTGWIVAIALSLSLYIPIRFAFTMPQSQYVVYSVVVVCVAAGTFAGGFFAVRVAREKIVLSAVLIGLVGVGIAVVILLLEWTILFPFPSVTLGWLVILAASFGGVKAAEKMLRKVTFESLFVVRPTEENLYQDLFIKTGYDHDTAKRLIEYERLRAPQAKRSQLIRNAIQRWEHDNRTG